MKRLTLTLLALSLLVLPGCDAGALEFTACTAQDDKLSLAFRSPKKALKYLEALVEANEQGERIDDTVELVKRVKTCIEPLVD